MRSAVHARGTITIRANLTPMIDMTFLLIVFFVLVSQITDRQRVRMDLPAPRDPATMRQEDERRLVINIVPGATDEAPAIVFVDGAEFVADADGLAGLRVDIERRYVANPGVRVNLRADRLSPYRVVEPVMQALVDAAAAAGVLPRVNLVVVRED